MIGDPDGRGGIVGFKPDQSAMNAEEFAAAFPPGTAPVAKITDMLGRAVAEPVLFNGDGMPLNISTEAPVWLTWSVLSEANLHLLDL